MPGPVDNRFPTEYTQVDDFGGADLMDPPDLFGDLYDVDAHEEAAPMGKRPSYSPPGALAAVPRPRIKDDTVLLPGSPAMAAALALADERGDLVTSGREGYSGDGVHATTSQHYQGLAIDLRFAGDRERQARAYRDLGYVALVEADHLHVQRYALA
jgi:hypothetical protein